MAEGAASREDQVMSRRSTAPEHVIAELLAKWNDELLFQLSDFYRERLKKAIEDDVEGFSFILRQKGYFTEQEHEKIRQLVEMTNRTDAAIRFLSLVMKKGSQARRLMWDSFLKMRGRLPKLEKILKEIEELGPVAEGDMDITRVLTELSVQFKVVDFQQKHKEFLRIQNETLRENVNPVPLVDRYTELTIISDIRDLRLVEDEFQEKGRMYEELRQMYLREELEKIQIDQLFHPSFHQTKAKSGRSAAVLGGPGIGKSTMVQKIIFDWAMEKIYQQFQFVFCFKFRDFNLIHCKISLGELILNEYPHMGNILGEIWKNPEGLLFAFDGLDEFKERINFADSQRDTEHQHICTDPELKCYVSDIVYSLIQHKLLPGCSVLVTTRPVALHLLGKAEISIWTEILGFAADERKHYFNKRFEDQMVAKAVFKHVMENEILYTMSYNPTYCGILTLILGPFFMQRNKNLQNIPKTTTQLFSCRIHNILEKHHHKIKSPRDVLLRVGWMAFMGVSDRKILFTDRDLKKFNLQPSRFVTEFLVENFERKDSTGGAVYSFPHLIIQEFLAALAQFLTPGTGDILKLLNDSHRVDDGRFEVFLRFVAGLTSPKSRIPLEMYLGQFSNPVTCRVFDWVKEEVKQEINNSESVSGRRSLLNTLYYLFENENSALAREAMISAENLVLGHLQLNPIDCLVVSQALEFCDTIKTLNLCGCYIQREGLKRLRTGIYKCQEIRLGINDLGDSGVKLITAILKDPKCKIERLGLNNNGLTDSCIEDLVSALSINQSLTWLELGYNHLGDSGVKLFSEFLRDPQCKIESLWLNSIGLTECGAKDLTSALSTNRSLTEMNLNDNKLGDSGVKLLCGALRKREGKLQSLRLKKVGLTDSCTEELISTLSANQLLTHLDLGYNSLTDLIVTALRSFILTLPSLQWISLPRNHFSPTGKNELMSVREPRPQLTIEL